VASSKREKELARQRAERQAARRAAAARRRKQRNAVVAAAAAVALVVAAVVVGALVLRDPADEDQVAAAETSTAPSAPASASASAEASTTPSADAGAARAGAVTCTYEKNGEPAKQAPLPPTDDVETEQVYEVTLATDRGDIVFEMDSAAAPCTANSLRSLAAAEYFDGTRCHRLTTAGIEVLQCGDPTGTGSGGPGYQFADENLEGATYPRGTVAMANAGPGTNGSQFFLVYGDSTLPAQYTPFGRITSGLEVLDEVAEAGDVGGTGDGEPVLPVSIETLRAEPKPA